MTDHSSMEFRAFQAAAGILPRCHLPGLPAVQGILPYGSFAGKLVQTKPPPMPPVPADPGRGVIRYLAQPLRNEMTTYCKSSTATSF
eukprot:g42323.t1